MKCEICGRIGYIYTRCSECSKLVCQRCNDSGVCINCRLKEVSKLNTLKRLAEDRDYKHWQFLKLLKEGE